MQTYWVKQKHMVRDTGEETKRQLEEERIREGYKEGEGWVQVIISDKAFAEQVDTYLRDLEAATTRDWIRNRRT